MSFNPKYNEAELWQQRIEDFLNRPKNLLPFFAILTVLIIGWSSFYTVQPDEEAVILRFGKYVSTASPGLHLKLPLGVDQAIKVKTKLVLQQEFGFRTKDSSAQRTAYARGGAQGESLMLTGDLNVADVEWITQFQISEPQKYLFNVQDPIQNIRDISEAIMRRVVGDRLVNDVLTVGRAEIAAEAKLLTQQVLDVYDMGIRVVSIKLQDVNPPEPVKPSFNEVNEAKQEQEQAINQAEQYYNKIIPEARGKAEKKISEAEGYAEAIVNRARGDAERFQAMLTAYRQSPAVTKDRMYLESMEKILKNLKRVTVVDPEIKGLLPVFGGGLKGEK